MFHKRVDIFHFYRHIRLTCRYLSTGHSPLSFSPDRPYNDLPSLPPRKDVETRDVLRACIAASAALAGLKEAAHLVPNPSMLINTLPVLEAQASSAIENIVTTNDRLFQYADDAGAADPATKDALRYRSALKRGFDSLDTRPLTTATVVDVCRTVTGLELDVRKIPGTRLQNAATGATVYTPPEGADALRGLLANWERYLHDETAGDPLIRMAVGHYQFEAIHPFVDGNGRTGRILNLLFLVEQGLLDLPILYLSKAIIATKADYYRLLNEVTAAGRWEPWVLYLLNAVADTAQQTKRKIHAIRELLRVTTAHVKAAAPSIYTRELVELIFVQPYSRIGNVVDAGIARRQTASEYLKQLCAIGALEERKAGRDKLFVHPKLITLLTSDDNIVRAYPT
jgi:Fic family protein